MILKYVSFFVKKYLLYDVSENLETGLILFIIKTIFIQTLLTIVRFLIFDYFSLSLCTNAYPLTLKVKNSVYILLH
jgi:hypothetical protein